MVIEKIKGINMLFTQLEKINNSFSEEFDVNKLSKYKNLILISLDKSDMALEMLCGNDEENLYLLFHSQDVKKEIANLFNQHNKLNEQIDYNKNFLIIVSLEKSLLTSHDTNATVMHVKDIDEILKVLDDFQNQNIIHGIFKRVSLEGLKSLWGIAKKYIFK